MSNHDELEDLEATNASEVTGGDASIPPLDYAVGRFVEREVVEPASRAVESEPAERGVESGRQAASDLGQFIKHGPDRPA